MFGTILNLLYGCRHKRLSRPITLVHTRAEAGLCYIVCLDCGQQFHYDTENMQMGRRMLKTPACSDTAHFQSSQ